MVILIMGPQGSGKTTQAEQLAKHLGIPFISMGKVLRDLHKANDPVGVEAHEYWDDGELVPDDLIRKVAERYFSTHDISEGFIMDGFPRDLPQYEWMTKVFKQPITAVIELHIEHDEIMRRLNKRRRLENREDETPKAIATRLKHYEEDTLPLLERFKKDGYTVLTIDGNNSIEQIQDNIQSTLKPHL